MFPGRAASCQHGALSSASASLWARGCSLASAHDCNSAYDSWRQVAVSAKDMGQIVSSVVPVGKCGKRCVPVKLAIDYRGNVA